MSDTSSPKRPRMEYEDAKDDHYEKFQKGRDQDDQNFPKSKRKREETDDDEGKDEEKSKSVIETGRRENTLVIRLANKEQELQECMNQIQEMKQAQTQNTAQLRSMLLDPAINLVFQRMAKEMDEHKEKLKQKQNELSAWKFTPDSQTGMRLMVKCRMLLQENGDLGKMISSGRTAKLEGEIALHKALVTEMKQNQKELDEFVGELEEDVEGMQGMIFMLQQQLKEAREQISKLLLENEQLRTLSMPPDPEPGGNRSDNVENQLSPKSDPSQVKSSDLSVSTSDMSSNKVSPSISSSLRAGVKKEPTTEEDSNGGFLCFKATPDSGMYTLEEDPGIDNAEKFTDRLSESLKKAAVIKEEIRQDRNIEKVTSSSSINSKTSSNPALSDTHMEDAVDSTANFNVASKLSNSCKYLSDNLTDSCDLDETVRTSDGKISDRTLKVKTSSDNIFDRLTNDNKINDRTKDELMDSDERTCARLERSEKSTPLCSRTEGENGEMPNDLSELIVNGASD